MALNYAHVEDLGDPDERAFMDAEHTEETYEDDLGDDEEVLTLNPEDAKFVHELVTRTLLFCETLADIELRPYQRDLGYRIIESLILADGEEITALWARQSGKSETVSVVIAGIVVLFPKLAESFAIMERFKRGVWIGVFGPTDQLSQWVYKKVAGHLTSDYAQQVLDDPEINEQVKSGSSEIRLKSGSFIRRQTANPRAKVEGATYHIVLIDEAQDADDTVVRKSINPMLATTAGTKVKIGTPSFHKGDFFQSIQFNKRRATQRGQKRNHFEFDWKTVAKYNPFYERHIKQEKLRIGEDSDEFLMSYSLKWMLDRGMLITSEDLDFLADPSMQVVKAWQRTPVVVGIDPARTKDSTVVTVCWVDWDHPDPAGYREHRILNWLEINNADWESQYFQIMEFLEPYKIAYIGVDAQGMGSAVAERLERLMGHRCEVIGITSDLKNQSERWKHLIQLLQRNMIIYPGHSKARRLRVWKRFRQQMEDAEKVFKNQYLLVQAPDDTRNAHDDFVDSLALACAMSMKDTVEEVQAIEAPWFRHR